MLRGVDLVALVRCLKINRQCCLLCVAVLREESALHIRCGGRCHAFRDMNRRIEAAHGAVEYKPRVATLSYHNV